MSQSYVDSHGESLIYAVDGALATIAVDRPQVMNALDGAMITALRNA